MKRVLYTLTIAGCLVAIVACSPDTLSPEEQLTELKLTAWEHFEDARYVKAEKAFREVTQTTPADNEAQLGFGWSLIHRRSLAAAAQALSRIGRRDTLYYAHAQAGLAIVYDAQSAYDRTIAAAEEALTSDTTYVFIYDRRVDWRDLTYLQAKSYFVASHQLDPTLNQTMRYLRRIDSGPELLSADSSTWIASGRHYATLAEAILKRLESLHALLVST